MSSISPLWTRARDTAWAWKPCSGGAIQSSEPGGPGLFIGEIEGTRLLSALTCFVLREANNTLTQLPFPQHWHISINICARHLLEDRFVEDICESAGPML